jgi:hypothetical protein
MKLKVVGDWIQYVTEAGKTFYYNPKNGNFQWEHPDITESIVSNKESLKKTDWKPFVDETTGNLFWFNQTTKRTQWECPLDSPSKGIHSIRSSSSDQNKIDFYDDNYHDIVEVKEESDLGI